MNEWRDPFSALLNDKTFRDVAKAAQTEAMPRPNELHRLRRKFDCQFVSIENLKFAEVVKKLGEDGYSYKGYVPDRQEITLVFEKSELLIEEQAAE
jgi:hypothetical protein